MRRCLFFLLSFFTPSLFSAYVADEEMRKAEIMFEADEMHSAINKYEDLLDYPLPFWKHEIIKYDIGTVLLANQKWSEALTYFQSISDTQIPRLLDANLKRNILLTNLKLAKEQIALLNSSTHLDLPVHNAAFEQAIFLFLQVRLDLDAAKQSFCFLSKALGNQECSLSEELKEIELEVKIQFAALLDQVSRYQILIEKTDEKSSLKGGLKKLLFTYEVSFLEQSPQKSTIETLEKLQKEVSGLIEINSDQDYEQANYFLGQAKKMSQALKPVQARMMLEMARGYLVHVLQRLDPSSNSPEKILEGAIADEELAVRLNQIQRFSEDRKDSHEIPAILLKSQQNVKKSATQFFHSVLQQQKKLFSMHNESSIRCQKEPWNEAIPLFIEGLDNAENAQKQLSEKTFYPITALRFQKEAVLKWKEVLKKLHSPPQQEPQKKPESANPSEKEKEESNKKEENSSENDRKLQETLRTLQQMEEEDRSRSKFMIIPSKNKEERPW
jgi:hypothetical protein